MASVFICRDNDSVAHQWRVRELAKSLSEQGIDAELEIHTSRDPDEWRSRYEEQLRPGRHDFVLLVCASAPGNRSVSSQIIGSRVDNRFIAVLLDGAALPPAMHGHFYYRIRKFDRTEDDEYAALVAHLNRHTITNSESEVLGLLRQLGVKANYAKREELVVMFSRHPALFTIALKLVAEVPGTILSNVESDTDAIAYKLVQACEQRLEKEGRLLELELLRVLTLFDGPAAPDCLSVLRGSPIPSFTEVFSAADDLEWIAAVERLVELGLVHKEQWEPGPIVGYSKVEARRAERGQKLGKPRPLSRSYKLAGFSALDVNPLIREYFSRDFSWMDDPPTYAAHSLLFEHLQNSVPYWPEGLNGLLPLVQAVGHACHASRFDLALDVYQQRILRQPADDYSRKIGALAVELKMLGGFFAVPWTKPVPELSEEARTWVLSRAASLLRATGRLVESLELLRKSASSAAEHGDWQDAANRFLNVSELELSLGQIEQACFDADRSVTLAERSQDALLRVRAHAANADALHQAGRTEEARASFVEANRPQKASQPDMPLLNPLSEFHHCDLLLAELEREAWRDAGDRERAKWSYQITLTAIVAVRARNAMVRSKRDRSPFAVGLEQLVNARLGICSIVLTGSRAMRKTLSSANEALRAFRLAWDQELSARALLMRGWLYTLMDRRVEARADLDEAQAIAAEAGLPLVLADACLHRARLFFGDDPVAARRDLDVARSVIEKTGYGRRTLELEDSERRFARLREKPAAGDEVADGIDILEGVDAVREKARVYIGDTDDGTGLHNMVYEVLAFASDDLIGGDARHVQVTIHVGNSVTVQDNGRGIPVDMDLEEGRSKAEVIMTSLPLSKMLPNLGVSVVNALSEWMELETHRDGFVWRQRYERGIPVAPLEKGEGTEARSTRITFKPDREIFSMSEMNREALAQRLRELAFLQSDFLVTLSDQRTGRFHAFHYQNGLTTFVQDLNAITAIPFFLRDTRGGESLEIALQWSDGDTENIQCFTNTFRNLEGGTHLDGLMSALTRTFLERLEGLSLHANDIRRGLTAAISVRIHDPKFSSPNRDRLDSLYVKTWVEDVVSERLPAYLEENPAEAGRVTKRLIESLSDKAEASARSELAALQYEAALRSVRNAISLDPARAERLQNEFGFLLHAYDEDGNVLDSSTQAADRLRWCTQIWRTIAAGNSFPLPDLVQVAPRDEVSILVARAAPVVIAQRGSAERKGEALEDAVERLFRTFFQIGDEIPWKIRKQKHGTQGGYDLGIEWSGNCEAIGEVKSRCHIECKNYRNEITPADVSGKLFSEPRKNPVIDHWILISPRSNPSNELNRVLEHLVEEETFPFEVQIWCPETGLDELFGLEPAVYDLFYQPREGEPHPRDWDESKLNEVRARWRKRLEPPLRLPQGWSDYLRDPALLCVHQEDPEKMAQTYETHVAMRCRNDAGALLEKSLDDCVDDWLASDDHPVCVLLGEFGDGKSFFTYSLARRLVANWQKAEGRGWLPLRLALRRAPPDPRDFLRQRLEVFHAGVAGWNAMGKRSGRLVILDGFDEMSVALDPKTVTENIRKLLACIDEFAGCKVLVTSRKHFFQNRKDAQRLLTRTGQAQIYALAPISRSDVIRNVTAAAADAERQQMTERFRSMHDPIGLAGKPLFLEMLKDVLVDPELPHDFDVVTLYERYITRSLSRKAEWLDDPELLTTRAETIGNLRAVLGEIAEELQQSGLGYVCLSDFKSATDLPFAKLLWRLSGPEALEQDAKARIGGRSLLGRVDTGDVEEWPVDFCHRSMREYFVAERLCAALESGAREAERFLREVPVNHEILDFAAQRLRKLGFQGVEGTLFELLKYATQPPPAGVGGRALTLLYRLQGRVPGDFDWRGKNFDGVDLEGADLSRLDFSGSSLRNAILSNVNFEDSNFSGCDLSGVRIEETKPVAALAADPSGESIIAAYSDGALRTWQIKPGGRATSALVGKWPAGCDASLGIHQSGQAWLRANDEWWLLNRKESGPWDQVARFRIEQSFVGIRPRGSLLAVTHSGADTVAQTAVLVDVQRNGKLWTATPGATRHCAAFGTNGLVWSDAAVGFRVEQVSASGVRRAVVLPCGKPSSLANDG